MKKILLASTLLFAFSGLNAQPGFQLIKDIGPDGNSQNADYLYESNGKIFFNAGDSSYQFSMGFWVSDGTTAGTMKLSDKRRTPVYIKSSASSSSITDAYFIYKKQKLFLNGKDYFNLEGDLYSTDGTPAGTQKVSDVNLVEILGVYLNRLFLLVNDQTTGLEIWTSDGTDSGTVLLKDINPKKQDNLYTRVTDLIEFNGKLIFSKDDDSSRNIEPWVTDGTPAGTMKLKEIHPTASSSPINYVILNNKVLFLAQDTTTAVSYGHIYELWSTDGTPAGTQLVKRLDLNTVVYGTHILKPIVYKNKAYFSGIDVTSFRTWETDGTTAGTNLYSTDKRAVGVLNNKLMLAKEITSVPITSDLYATTGTDAQATLIKRYSTDADHTLYQFETIDNKGFFLASHYALNYRLYASLWETDGTDTGTKKVSQENVPLKPNAINYFPVKGSYYIIKDKSLYLSYMSDTSVGYELYKYTPAVSNTDTGNNNTGINISQKDEHQFWIYPNPTSESVTVRLSDIFKGNTIIRIYDMAGKLVLSKKVNHSGLIAINISSLSSGQYLIKLDNSNYQASSKLIVE